MFTGNDFAPLIWVAAVVVVFLVVGAFSLGALIF